MEHGGSAHDGAAHLTPLQDPYVLAALSGASMLLLAWTYPLWGATWDVVCALRAITGIPCPTCYGTRAMLALMAGNWGDAVRLNPLVAAAGVALFAVVPWAGLTAAAGLPRPGLPAAWAPRAAWAAAGLMLCNWVYLIAAHGLG